MSSTGRYRSLSIFDRLALLVSLFLVGLVFLCFAFLIAPRPFYQLLLPLFVFEVTGATINFERVEVPTYFEPSFKNLSVRMPGAPAFFSRRLIMHFEPDKIHEPTQFIKELVANDVTVESINGVALQTATIIPLPPPTQGLAFRGVVKTEGFGKAKIEGTMYGTDETFINVNLRSRALSLKSLAGRWGLPDVVDGSARARLSVSGHRKRNELWHISPQGVLTFNSIKMTSQLFRFEKARGSLQVDGSVIKAEIADSELLLQGAKAMHAKGALSLTTEAIEVSQITIESPNGGRVFLSSKLPLDSKLSSSYKQLPHWSLLRTVIANLERQEKPLTAKVRAKGIPATILSGHRGLPLITDGTVSGAVSFSALARLDGLHDIETTGKLHLENFWAQQGKIRIERAYGDFSLEESVIEAELSQSEVYIPGQDKLRGKGGLTWSPTKGWDISKFQLIGKDDVRFSLSARKAGDHDWPNDIDLKVQDLAVGPDLPIAPTIGGLPLIGRLSLNMTCQRGDLTEEALQSAGRLTARFTGRPGTLLPVKGRLVVEQGPDIANVVGALRHSPTSSVLDITAVVGGNDKSQIRMKGTSIPLDFFQGIDELKDWRLSFELNVDWNQKKAEYPLVTLSKGLPAKATIQLKCLQVIDGSGKEAVKLDRAVTLDYVRDSLPQGTVPLHLYEFPITLSLSEIAQLNLSQADIIEIWKAIFPNELFLKPKGKMDIGLSYPPFKGECVLLDGGFEHWSKSGKQIWRLSFTLPDLYLSIAGNLDEPRIATKKVNEDFELQLSSAKDKWNIVTKSLPLSYSQYAPVENVFIRQGEVRVSSDFTYPIGDKTSIDFSGWAKEKDEKLTISGQCQLNESGDDLVSFNASSETTDTAAKIRIESSEDVLHSDLFFRNFPLIGTTISSTVSSKNSYQGGLRKIVNEVSERGYSAVASLLRKEGTITVKDFELYAYDTKTVAPSPFTITVARDGVHLDNVALDFDGHRFLSHGHFSPDGPCDLSLSSDGVPLKALTNLIGLQSLGADGTVTASLNISGVMPIPKVRGAVRVDCAKISIPDVKERLTLPSIEIKSQGQTTLVSATGFTWGDVPIAAGGRISPASQKAHLKVRAIDLPLTVGRSHLEKLCITGDAQFTADEKSLDVKATCGGGSIALPTRVPASDSSTTIERMEKFLQDLGDLKANLTIDIPQRVRVFNSFLSADVTGSCRVTATPNPTVSSRIELVRGHLTLHRHEFDLTSGVLTLSGPIKEVKATLVLNARTKVKDHTIDLTVSGSLEEPKVNLSSMPPLPESNIVELLTTGVISNAASTDAIADDLKGTLGASAKDYIASSALNDVLFAGLGLGTFSVRTTNEQSTVTVRQHVGNRLRFAVDRVISSKTSTEKPLTSFSFELGLNKNLFIEGKTDGANDSGSKSGTYLGLFRSFRFR